MSKYGFSRSVFVCIWTKLQKNTRKYRYDFSTDGKIKIILLNIKSRSALRLTLLSLKLCKTLETVLEDVTTSGVSLILATTN